MILAGLCGAALTLVGCASAEAPPELPSAFGEVEAAPEGAVYRSWYRGYIEAYMASRARWLEDQDGFEISLSGSGNCPDAPTSIKVLTSDHLRIETERMITGGCTEDSMGWSFVFDTPHGLDTTLPVRVDIVTGLGTSTEEMAPRD